MHLIITYYGAKEVLLPGPTMKLRQKINFCNRCHPVHQGVFAPWLILDFLWPMVYNGL